MSKARSLADLISGGATIEASEIADSTITGGKLASDIAITTSGNISTTGDLTVDTNTLYVDSTNNKVGVGTTSPSTTLDIQPSIPNSGIIVRRHNVPSQYIHISETDGARHLIEAIGDKEFRIFNEAPNNPTTFFTNSTERMRIDQSGNVGIGTSSPSYKAHIQGTDGISASIRAEATDTDSDAFIVTDNDANVWTMGIDGDSSDSWMLSNAFGLSSPKITVTTGGKLGLGTTNPSTELHIATTGDPTITLEDTSGLNQLRIRYNATGLSWVSGIHGGENAFKISENTTFGTNDYFTVKGTTGYVGIGTSSPTQALDVVGNITASGNLTSLGIDDNATSNAITIDSSGNTTIKGATTLIQNTSGNSLLRVRGSVSGYEIRIESTFSPSNLNIPTIYTGSATGRSLSLQSGDVAGDGIYLNAYNATGTIRFKTADTERMRITSDGKVGIGTSSPVGGLEVNNSSGIKITRPSYSQYMELYPANNNVPTILGLGGNGIHIGTTTTTGIHVDGSDNVGIGTTSPVSVANIEATKTTALSTANDFLTLGLTVDDNTAKNTNVGGGISFRGVVNTGGGKSVFAAIDGVKSNTTGNNVDGVLRFFTNNSSTGVPSERMRIDSSGKVGINTTSPYGKFEVHSGGAQSNYSGSSAIKSGVTWGSEASSHTISIFNYNEADNSSGMLLVHAKGDNNKCGTLMLLFTKKGGSGVSITTVSSKTDGMSTFSASTSGNTLTISTDSDCAICWQSFYGV